MAHTVIWEPRYLHRKFSGEITGEDILKSNFEIQADPRFAKIKYLVNDFSKVESVLVDPGHSRIFALTDDIISNTKGKLKIAVITDDEALIELINYYRDAMKNKLFKCEIFSSIEEARNWGEQDW